MDEAVYFTISSERTSTRTDEYLAEVVVISLHPSSFLKVRAVAWTRVIGVGVGL